MGYVKQQMLKEQQIRQERALKELKLDSFDMHRQIDECGEQWVQLVDCMPEEMEVDTDVYYSCNISEQK